MKKTDIKVGQEYAVGSTSSLDTWRLAHARVIELDRLVPTHAGSTRMEKRIVVELVEDSNAYRARGNKGEQLVLKSARDVIQPWATYAEQKTKHDERKNAEREEKIRRDTVVVRTREALLLHGIDVDYNFSAGKFTIAPDILAKIVALIPEGSS